MVLAIAPALLSTVLPVQAGAVLKFSTETFPDLRGITTAISGGPLLVHEGRRQSWSTPTSDGPLPYAVRSMGERHPRTALAWDDHYVYLIEVDGRQKKLSVGMTLNELADFIIGMGGKEAVNFDGGGSAMFWCNGRIVNSPCDKREREVANALVVLRKPAPHQATAIAPIQ
jgi:exopolysaccharide biosynthesis protein